MHYADLHIHSCYSDGSFTPVQIVAQARRAGVRLLSVTDHNLVRGTLETAPLAAEAGLDFICGVEIDAMHEGRDIHILCYGADLGNEALLTRIRHARRRLDEMSVELLRRMLPDYPCLSLAEYEQLEHDSRRSGRKMLQYLQARGVTGDLKAGLTYYDRYGVTYAEAGFDAADTVVHAIHAAGGRAVLAHPGVVFPTDRLSTFEGHVLSALEPGLDGVEYYYPRHDASITRRCLDICNARGLMITAGSDCHGAFNRSQIGQTQTRVDQLRLE